MPESTIPLNSNVLYNVFLIMRVGSYIHKQALIINKWWLSYISSLRNSELFGIPLIHANTTAHATLTPPAPSRHLHPGASIQGSPSSHLHPGISGADTYRYVLLCGRWSLVWDNGINATSEFAKHVTSNGHSSEWITADQCWPLLTTADHRWPLLTSLRDLLTSTDYYLTTLISFDYNCPLLTNTNHHYSPI